MRNKTDMRIAKFYDEGCSFERIAKRIGQPGNIKRVREGLIREGRIKE